MLVQVTKGISYYILYYFQNSVFIIVDLEDKHERWISTEQFYVTNSCSTTIYTFKQKKVNSIYFLSQLNMLAHA